MSEKSYIFGRNSVLSVLTHQPERVFKVLMADGLKPDKRLDAIYEEARQLRITLQKVPRVKLDALCDDPEISHQGVVAMVSPRPLLSIYELIEKTRTTSSSYPLILMLDGITDPRNFGAILRSADASGVDGVVITKQHSAGFGPAVGKTASGAESTMDVALVSNIAQSLRPLKDAGFWIVGADHRENAVAYYQQDYNMPTVLIMGSEGKGISRVVEKQCDFRVKIPMHGTVDSLNVAAAAAVLLFDIRARQQ